MSRNKKLADLIIALRQDDDNITKDDKNKYYLMIPLDDLDPILFETDEENTTLLDNRIRRIINANPLPWYAFYDSEGDLVIQDSQYEEVNLDLVVEVVNKLLKDKYKAK